MAHLEALELDGGIENERIRTGNGDETAVRAPNPWNVVPVLKAHDQLGPHLHLPLNAPDDPDDSRMMMPGRHEVDDLYDAGRVVISVSSTIDLTPIAADVGGDLVVGGDPPAAVVVISEELCEATP